MERSDEALMLQLQTGNSAAFEILVKRWEKLLLSYCYRAESGNRPKRAAEANGRADKGAHTTPHAVRCRNRQFHSNGEAYG